MFIRIEKNSDGSHTTQFGGNLHDGWAFVPSDMAIPDTFPFVNIETAMVTHHAVIRKHTVMVDGKPVEKEVVVWPEYTQIEVVSMTEGEQIPVEVPEAEPTAQDDTDSMLVDHELRLTMLELGLV